MQDIIKIIGVDCSAEVGLAMGEYHNSGISLFETKFGSDGNSIAEIIVDWIQTDDKVVLAIDAPLGWPEDLGNSLSSHLVGQTLSVESNLLFRRETERFIKKTLGKQPLDVGADRIARRTNPHQPMYDMVVIADGYMESALILARKCLEDNNDKKADIVIFPILFSVNHAIELYLKATNWALNILLKNEERYTGGHDIIQVWNTVKKRSDGYESTNKERKNRFRSMTQNLKKYLHELQKKLDSDTVKPKMMNMDFSRYPINGDGEYHFYLQTYDNVVVDLENLVIVFEEIGDSLNLIASDYIEKATFVPD
ncbi:MAG: DUF429 domain-containing protein [Hungatella sp.]|nr:DUF429 domain-containing protein [Hungatella sp.]